MNAFLFVPLLAMTWIFGLFLSMIVSHYFLCILEDSAQGNEEIELPVEPFVDWCGKVVYLGFFLILWSIPSMMMLAATRGMDFFPRALLVLGIFWILFPIGIISPMSLASKWIPFWPELPLRMSQKFNVTVQFYLLTFPIVMILGFAISKILDPGENFAILFGMVPLTALGLMVYARILGRYGFVLTFTSKVTLMPEKQKKKPGPRRPRPIELEPVYVQPSEMESLRDPFDQEVTGYDVNFQKSPPKVREEVRTPRPEEPEESYDVVDNLEVVEGTPQSSLPIANPELERAFKPPDEQEIGMYLKNRKVKEFKAPFGLEVILFLTSPSMTSALIKLTAGIALFALLLQGLRIFRPV